MTDKRKSAEQLDQTISGIKGSIAPSKGDARPMTIVEGQQMKNAVTDLATANVELIRSIEKNEEDNEKTREVARLAAESAKKDRKAIAAMLRFSIVSGVIGGACVAMFVLHRTNAVVEDVRDRRTQFAEQFGEFERKFDTFDKKFDRSLETNRKLAEAVGAQLEASTDEEALEAAKLKAVEAQEATLEAAVEDARLDGAEPTELERKLEEVKAKKRAMVPNLQDPGLVERK